MAAGCSQSLRSRPRYQEVAGERPDRRTRRPGSDLCGSAMAAGSRLTGRSRACCSGRKRHSGRLNQLRVRAPRADGPGALATLDDVEGSVRHMRGSRAQKTTSPDPGASGRAGSSPEAEAKYPRPKILVIDAPDVTPALQQRGYAAMSGSFGQPVVVPKAAANLIIDMPRPDPQDCGTDLFESPAQGVRSVWAPAASGLVDPRPATMLHVRDAMDRIPCTAAPSSFSPRLASTRPASLPHAAHPATWTCTVLGLCVPRIASTALTSRVAHLALRP